MLSTKEKSTLAIAGIDQQDFSRNQLVDGCFPFQIGLQQRIPGKDLQEVFSTNVGSIFPFYMIYGRPYIMLNFANGSLRIQEVNQPKWTLPKLASFGNDWFDDFSGYDPVGLISRLWAAGVWLNGVGICESLIEGWFDPFLVYAKINSESVNFTSTSRQVTDSSNQSASINIGAKFTYPKNPPDIVLQLKNAIADNGCEGLGYTYTYFQDGLTAFDGQGNGVETIRALDIAIGDTVEFYGIKVGRITTDLGVFWVNPCDGSFAPDMAEYYFLNIADGEYGLQS